MLAIASSSKCHSGDNEFPSSANVLSQPLTSLHSALSSSGTIISALMRGGESFGGSYAPAMDNFDPSHHQSGAFGYMPGLFTGFYDDHGSQPTPAQGAPLLNDTEGGFLNHFFNDRQREAADPAFQSTTNDEPAEAEADFQWMLKEEAPRLHGVTAAPRSPGALHSQPLTFTTIDALTATTDGNQIFGPGGILASHPLSPDAHAFSRNMPQGQGPLESLHGPHALSRLSTDASIRPGDFDVIKNLNGLSADASSSELVLPVVSFDHASVHVPSTTAEGLTGGERHYQFGNDPHFKDGCFQPSSAVERHSVVEDQLTMELKRLKPINRSNDNSRASSPKPPARNSGLKRKPEESPGIDSDGLPPAKRSRSGAECDDSSDDDSKNASGSKKSATRARRATGPEPSQQNNGRRKSISGAKQPRENLTEEQKRSNHILSEQKRRNLIKAGFEDLNRMVPSVRTGGHSKSSVLMETANFIETILRVNEEIRRRMTIGKQI